MPSALITGLTGQDGSFLAELLLGKGYSLSALVRGGSDRSLGCAEHLRGQVALIPGDLLDAASTASAIELASPDELYHLASPSFVPDSWEHPAETLRAISSGAATLLETVRDRSPQTRVFLAASGGMFGDAGEWPQGELTPCRPTSPYAIAKLAAHQLLGVMRGHYGLHASSGIAFNHESERRPARFVTRRITRGAAAIALGLERQLTLGDLQAVRDWSFAGDLMQAAWLMLQQDEADDYVLASGVGRTVADFARTAFACVDLDFERYVRVDETLVRAPERTPNVGDPSKARERLGWHAEVEFEQLVERMVQADLQALQASGHVPASP